MIANLGFPKRSRDCKHEWKEIAVNSSEGEKQIIRCQKCGLEAEIKERQN